MPCLREIALLYFLTAFHLMSRSCGLTARSVLSSCFLATYARARSRVDRGWYRCGGRDRDRGRDGERSGDEGWVV